MLILLVVTWYLAVSLWGLDVVPPVYEDEPWQASTGWKIATDGVFGSDVFAGLHRMQERYYGYMPLHPLALAATFRLFGLGLLQARLESVAMGLLALALTWLVARRLTDRATALLSLVLLTCVSVTGITRYMPTGILWLDGARISRYDMPVPVAGLSAVLAYLWAAERGRAVLFALPGVLTALAGLTHLYGTFWLVVFVVLVTWNRAGWRPLLALFAGFALPWAFYGAYVLQDLEAWRWQTAGYGPRFDVLNWRFYWDNLRLEPRRYAAGMLGSGWLGLLRPGLWAALVLWLGTVPWLVRRALRGDRAARVLALPLLLFPLLFALLLQIKLASYLVLIAPIAAVATAWASTTLWRHPATQARRGCRLAMVAALVVVLIDGSARVAGLVRLSAATTPYRTLQARLHAPIPPGSRVLGLHGYWFGFEDTAFRSWLVPWMQAFSDRGPQRSIEAALDDVGPEFILLDPDMRDVLAEFPERGRRIDAWMRRRGFHVVSRIEDPTYGRIDIHRVGALDEGR